MNEFSLLASAPFGFAVIDHKHRFVQVNEKFIQKTPGKKQSDYIGHTVTKVMGARDWKDIKKYFDQALRGITTQDIPLQSSQYEASYYPIQLTTQKAVGMIIRDATEDRETEQSLDLYKQRLEQAQRAGKVGVFDWNIQTNKVWWSEEEEALFGVPPGKFQGEFSDWILAIHPEDRATIQKQIRQAIKEKTDLDVEFRVIYPGNIIHWIGARGHIYYKGKNAYRLIGVNYDVTERKQMMQLLTFKAEAARVLSSSWDYESTLQSVTKLATDYIADWCSIDIEHEKTGEVLLIAATHATDQKQVHKLVKDRHEHPIKFLRKEKFEQLFDQGKSVYIPFVSTKELKHKLPKGYYSKLIETMHAVSVMIIPLKVANKIIGAVTFLSAESKRHYTDEHLELAQQLASRASLAVENTQLYETVKNERERLDDLLSNVPGVVWESWGNPVDKTQKITYVSEHAERLLGYPREDWLTKKNFWLTIIHPEDKYLAAQVAHSNYKAGGPGVSRFRWVTKKGKAIWMESQSYVVSDQDGKPLGMRGIVMDISESMEQLRRKDEFLSLASHELKTPVTTIKAFNQILKNIVVKDISKEYLGKMEIQINKLTRLISELLDVSKIHEGKLELRRETIALDQFIADTASELQAIVKTHHIKLHLNSPVTVFGDRDRLAQVLSNIIMNGIKYSPNAHEILVSSSVEDTFAYIRIQDFGIGIEAKHHSKIFNRFYRIANETKAPGLGIGLFISKEILTRHGGDLTVASKHKKGATFTIKLPVQ